MTSSRPYLREQPKSDSAEVSSTHRPRSRLTQSRLLSRMARRFSVASGDYGDEPAEHFLRKRRSSIAEPIYSTKEHHAAVAEYLRIRSWAASIVNTPETPPGLTTAVTQTDSGPPTIFRSEDQKNSYDASAQVLSEEIRGVSQPAQSDGYGVVSTDYRSAPSLIRRKPLPKSASRTPQPPNVDSAPASGPTAGSAHRAQATTPTYRLQQRLSRPLHTKTRDARQCSNEGLYLGIGTLRGPTPDGLRELQRIMEKSLAETKGVEKGVRKINKLMRHERRDVIEWVDGWLRWTWGVRY